MSINKWIHSFWIGPVLFLLVACGGGEDSGKIAAQFTVSPERPELQQEVNFSAGDSKAREGEIREYRWEFDDGLDPEVTPESTIRRTFWEPGEYEVTLSVVDGGGNTASVTRTVTVIDPAADSGELTVEFEITPDPRPEDPVQPGVPARRGQTACSGGVTE